MTALFRNSAFAKLFIAAFASQLGSVVGNMAFAFYLIDRFSSRPTLATTAELMYSLPTIAVFWIVGVIADRFDRQRIAAYSDWIRAGLTLLLLIFVHYDLLIACFLMLFLRSSVAKFFGPAEMGLLQGSIGQGQYVQATGLNQTMMGLFMLFGMSLGATAYHFIGIGGAIVVDGVSFLISGALIAWARFPESARMPNGENWIRDIRLPLLLKDFMQGVRYIMGNRLLLILISGFFFFGIVNGAFSVLPLFTMKYKISPDQYMIHASLITLCLGVGYLVGSVIGMQLVRRMSKTRILVVGLFISSLLIVGLGFADRVDVYLSLVLVVGIVIAPINIALGSWMPELVPPQNMGRVNALIEPVMMLGHSLSLLFLAVAFPMWVSISWIHYLLGLCTIGTGMYYMFALPPLVHKYSERNQRLSSGA